MHLSNFEECEKIFGKIDTKYVFCPDNLATVNDNQIINLYVIRYKIKNSEPYDLNTGLRIYHGLEYGSGAHSALAYLACYLGLRANILIRVFRIPFRCSWRFCSSLPCSWDEISDLVLPEGSSFCEDCNNARYLTHGWCWISLWDRRCRFNWSLFRRSRDFLYYGNSHYLTVELLRIRKHSRFPRTI